MPAEIESHPARIVRLLAENILPLTAVEITPDPAASTVKIVGPNSSGKTSVLRSIWMALGGKKFVPEDVIREGADEGSVTLDIGEATIRLGLRRQPDGRITESLIVKDRKGNPIKAPQQYLAGLINPGSFDPLQFCDSKPAEQVAMLKDALGIDTSALEATRKQTYERRTEINREVSTLEKRAASIAFTAGLPEQEQSEADIVAKFNEARAAEEHNRRLDQRLSSAIVQRDEAAVLVENLVKELAAARERLDQLTAAADEAAGRAKAERMEVPDSAALQESIAAIRRRNEAIRQNAIKRDMERQAKAKQREADSLTDEIASIDQAKREMIESSRLPVPGLSFDGEAGVLLNGHPLANAGGAEQLKVALALSMSRGDRLRVVTIDEGYGRLDDEQMQVVEAMAEQHQCQVWLTGPRAFGEECIEIREGAIVPHAVG